MRSRKRPPRSNGLLINVGIEMLRQGNRLMPGFVFLDLSSCNQDRILAAVERPDDVIKCFWIGDHSLCYLSRCHWLALACPIVHWNGNEHWSHRRLCRQVIPASDCGGHIFCPERLIGPLHVWPDS